MSSAISMALMESSSSEGLTALLMMQNGNAVKSFFKVPRFLTSLVGPADSSLIGVIIQHLSGCQDVYDRSFRGFRTTVSSQCFGVTHPSARNPLLQQISLRDNSAKL